MTWLAEEEEGSDSGRSDSGGGGSDLTCRSRWQMRRSDARAMTATVGGDDGKGGAATLLCTAEVSLDDGSAARDDDDGVGDDHNSYGNWLGGGGQLNSSGKGGRAVKHQDRGSDTKC
ncbi:hypothetical protein GW17_00019262 [Ensete ventricosum]|nr:hypothetical protein GW17_00019262 [Ensete ventricosum]